MITLKRSQTVNGVFTIIEVRGKTYVCPAWIEIPKDMKSEDIRVEKKIDPPKEKPKPDNSWEFEGSKGNIYSVTLRDGVYKCSCPAASFQRFKDCKHVVSLKEGKK